MTRGFAAPFSTEEPPIERRGQHEDWFYRAAVDRTEGRIMADVPYPLDTTNQVADFVRIQQELAQELISAEVPSLDATIVFRHPLDQATFEKIVQTYNLTVSSYMIRMVDAQGERSTIIGSPVENVIVPSDYLSLAMDDSQQRTPSNKLSGWIEVRATIPAQDYAALVENDQVYLIDVSRAVVQAAFSDDARLRDFPVEVLAPQIYWSLEDLDLVAN